MLKDAAVCLGRAADCFNGNLRRLILLHCMGRGHDHHCLLHNIYIYIYILEGSEADDSLCAAPNSRVMRVLHVMLSAAQVTLPTVFRDLVGAVRLQ